MPLRDVDELRTALAEQASDNAGASELCDLFGLRAASNDSGAQLVTQGDT